MERTEGEIVELLPLDEPKGLPCSLLWDCWPITSLITPSVVGLDAGSVQIDEAFERHVEGYLKDIKYPKLELPEHVAHLMARGPDFQTIKTRFQESSSLTAKIPLPKNPEIRVELFP